MLAFARPDYLVARYNTVCMEDTDYKYLMSLSTDASPALAADADFMENKGMVTMYARQLAGETNDSLRQLNVSHIKAAHLFRDSIDEVKSSQLILYMYIRLTIRAAITTMIPVLMAWTAYRWAIMC